MIHDLSVKWLERRDAEILIKVSGYTTGIYFLNLFTGVRFKSVTTWTAKFTSNCVSFICKFRVAAAVILATVVGSFLLRGTNMFTAMEKNLKKKKQ